MLGSDLKFAKLNDLNYKQWSENMEAYLAAKGCWKLASGASEKPSGTGFDLEAWEEKSDMARGILWLQLKDSQKVHVSVLSYEVSTESRK